MRDRESLSGCKDSSCLFDEIHFYKALYKPDGELDDASWRLPDAFEKSLSVTVGCVIGAMSVLI
jgi:hypothetical protein